MKEKNHINIRSLKDEAKKSKDRESFRELEKSSNYRISVGSRLTSQNKNLYFIEIVINFFPGAELDIALIEKNLMILKELEKNGYAINFDDTVCLYCEVNVDAEELDSVYKKIRKIIQKHF